MIDQQGDNMDTATLRLMTSSLTAEDRAELIDETRKNARTDEALDAKAIAFGIIRMLVSKGVLTFDEVAPVLAETKRELIEIGIRAVFDGADWQEETAALLTSPIPQPIKEPA